MRFLCPLLALSFLPCTAIFAAAGLILPSDVTIGRNLEVYSSIRLTEPAPAGGLEITITSGDPARLLFASVPDKPGSKSITLKINDDYVESPDFYLQGFGDAGVVNYTVSAPGFGTSAGKVKLAHSAILITGPFDAPIFQTTTGMPAKITIYSGMLDSSGKLVEQQLVAGGAAAKIEIATSDPAVGSVDTPLLTLMGGTASATRQFKPAGPGQTTLTPRASSDFTIAGEHAALTAKVDRPGIGIAGEVNIGKDLQIQAQVLLGEPAPPNGLDVTLASSDPKRLILSTRANEVGSASVTVHVPAGKGGAPYFIQSLGDSGVVNYSATAPGYRTRTAPVSLMPSGVMIVFSPYGPPDEAEVLRILPTHDPRPFTASLSDHRPLHLTIWTNYLDPNTRRGADITAQRLRAGFSAEVEVKSSDPKVARVTSPVVIKNASDFAMIDFEPLTIGQTVISVNEPAGFTVPANATSVTATVKE